jgi:hypothetical protein
VAVVIWLEGMVEGVVKAGGGVVIWLEGVATWAQRGAAQNGGRGVTRKGGDGVTWGGRGGGVTFIKLWGWGERD